MKKTDNEKELMFIDNFVSSGNAKQSCINAGYNPKTATSRGHQLKNKFLPEIQQKQLEKLSSVLVKGVKLSLPQTIEYLMEQEDKMREFKGLAELLIRLEPLIKPPIFLLHNVKNPFFDTMPNNSISLINLNSVKDFSKKINTDIEFERFRGNIYVKGMGPWDEFGLINKNIIINNCKFRVCA